MRVSPNITISNKQEKQEGAAAQTEKQRGEIGRLTKLAATRMALMVIAIYQARY